MGESKSNLATEGLSGQVGNLVFRRRKGDGKVFVSVHPAAREGEPSEAQQRVNSKFQEAVLYGKSIIADPETKALYGEKAIPGQSAYNIAVADFFHAPDIETIDISSYTGTVGDIIKIKATDNFKVTEVSVTIYNADGTEVEHGRAVQSEGKNEWVFTAKVANASIDGDRIEVRAMDLPGNETEKSVNS